MRNGEKTQTVIGFVVESNGTIVPVFNRIIFTSHDSPKSRLHLHGEQWRMRHIFIVITPVRFAAVTLATLRKRAASSSLCFHRHRHRHRHGSQHGRLWCTECLSCHLPEHRHCVGIFLIMTFSHEEGFPLQISRKPKRCFRSVDKTCETLAFFNICDNIPRSMTEGVSSISRSIPVAATALVVIFPFFK